MTSILDFTSHLPRFSAPCPICEKHSFIVLVEPADRSVGIMLPSIADVTIADDDDDDNEKADHLESVFETLYGDDEAAALALEKTLFAASRY